MDFEAWGQEYLDEAAQIKAKVDALRAALRAEELEQDRELAYRMAVLYSMYLECRHTGDYLRRYGRRAQ